MWLVWLFLHIPQSNGLQVIGANQTVVQGATVTFPCKLVDAEHELTQISWQRTTRAKVNNDFLTVAETNGPLYVNGPDDRLKFTGKFSEQNGSFQISNVSLQDEGVYKCIFTLFPTGSFSTDMYLQVHVPPVVRLNDTHLTLADEEVCIATCTAAGSRPQADVTWLLGNLEEKLSSTTNVTKHDNGTTTTVSSLYGVPTIGINQQVVQCVVTSLALSERIPFTIQVYFAPVAVKVEAMHEDAFQCVTDANPQAEYTWTRVKAAWPQSGVKVKGAMLHFLTKSSDLNGLYQCEAVNTHGNGSAYVFIHVASGHCTVCWILFSLLLILVAAAAVWYLYHSNKLPCFGSREGLPTYREGSSEPPEAQELGV